ncbi:hypothetical protein EN925_30020 [Mesorhizobium sp. M7A.F.Ca.US.006.04.2.1]|uniref:Uncharacterized protein n=1 Tax=Mesorhizobium ciceri biovar biserrulae (strain HAMBI 2942 / LMG 23838 / WSM1271) TaxID=765698 RepID=E8TLG0_MESCW|nr:hypothetical protein Mesci_3591 [Mesorhizobium ciceri biovar biserrulae WSM1271]ARP65291.1 hypothetical protein A9K65_019330 [Mesorhizobium sp. WSM1497]RUX71257.1 hypothetical protein EN990_28960 [Mesorhizobium sp. M7A.F.Ca.US.005.03.1.1]RUY11902.1 hypothetical protein EN991_24490 [Mesorhizobium sp. M7A.F.Ca.US.005.03.2.1]RUZ97378.1 hypothetical protein EN938_33490 [Mesorhizobium sp. M7A.F.Ca.US.001.02.1.1]RVA08567.1 hypothetical protein EN932_25465 [Mesorhizobium sp. M7A.F.Ca.US.002.01.1.1
MEKLSLLSLCFCTRGLEKHLTPNPPKFRKAIRTYERAYAMAVQRAGNCQAEKAKYPGLYR